MKTEDLIPIQDFCTHHKIEVTFISSLHEHGLIELTTIETTSYIDTEQMKDLERMARLHYELDINIEGIDAISHLLKRVGKLHDELNTLKNRLRLYEAE